MKKFLSGLLGLSLIAVTGSLTPAFGWAGGPWGNDSPDQTSGAGTYQGMMTGKNLLGVVFFGIGTNTESSGRFAVFHEGILHMGGVSAIVDMPSRTVAGALLGVAALPGEETGFSATLDSGGLSSAQTQVLTIRTGAEGAFQADVETQFPTVIFSGDGWLSTPANAVTTSTGTSTSLYAQNTQLTPDTTLDPGTQAVQTGESETGSAFLRNMTPFEIRGSRTSLLAPIFISTVTAVPPITPSSSSTTTIIVP